MRVSLTSQRDLSKWAIGDGRVVQRLEVSTGPWAGPAKSRKNFKRAGQGWKMRGDSFQRARPGRQKRNEFTNGRAGIQKKEDA